MHLCVDSWMIGESEGGVAKEGRGHGEGEGGLAEEEGRHGGEGREGGALG